MEIKGFLCRELCLKCDVCCKLINVLHQTIYNTSYVGSRTRLYSVDRFCCVHRNVHHRIIVRNMMRLVGISFHLM